MVVVVVVVGWRSFTVAVVKCQQVGQVVDAGHSQRVAFGLEHFGEAIIATAVAVLHHFHVQLVLLTGRSDGYDGGGGGGRHCWRCSGVVVVDDG